MSADGCGSGEVFLSGAGVDLGAGDGLSLVFCDDFFLEDDLDCDFEDFEDCDEEDEGRGLGFGVPDEEVFSTGWILSRDCRKARFFSSSLDCPRNVFGKQAKPKSRIAKLMKFRFRTPQGIKTL